MSVSKLYVIRKKNQGGFTLVELMIASTVFTIIILMCAAVVVRFTNSYQKSLVENSTQNVARSILDTVSQRLQFGGSNLSELSAPLEGYCISGTRYAMNRGQQLLQATDTGLVEEQGTGIGCTASSGPNKSQELLSTNMRLSFLHIDQISQSLYTVTVRVAYGDDDLFIDDTAGASSVNPRCKTEAGSQWCAVRELSTTVQRRL